jgi:hypothetical protein
MNAIVIAMENKMKCNECGKELTNETDCYGHDCEVNIGLQKSNSENIIKKCIGLMTAEQLVELYEEFNGGTFDNNSFREWIGEFI